MHVKESAAAARSMKHDPRPWSSSSPPAESAQLVKSRSWREFWRKHLLESNLVSARRRQTCSGCTVEKSPQLTHHPSIIGWPGSSRRQHAGLHEKPVEAHSAYGCKRHALWILATRRQP